MNASDKVPCDQTYSKPTTRCVGRTLEINGDRAINILFKESLVVLSTIIFYLLLLYYTTNPIILGVLHLYHSNLVCNIKGIIIWLKTNKCLLLTIWSDQSIHLFRLNVIQAGHSVLDLLFVGTGVNNKYKCVVVLNLLHSRLCGERVLDNSKGIQLLELWCTAACIEARMRYMTSSKLRN